MTAKEFIDQLNSLAPDDFAFASTELLDQWYSAKMGFEVVEPILRFMEEHTSIDYGGPGALVHFIEQFYGRGYEEKLLESIARKPTYHTIWMLKRVINGAPTRKERKRLLKVMENAKSHPLTDSETRDEISLLLEEG